MRSHGIHLLALGCLMAAFASSAAVKAEKAKREWEGTWECVSRVVNGKPEETKGWLLIHDGDSYTLKKGESVISEGTAKRDATAKPKTIDATPSSGKGKGKTAYGIYEVNGESMRLCLAPDGKERPKAFVSEEGSGNILESWKRVSR